jgi:hypothetical protein
MDTSILVDTLQTAAIFVLSIAVILGQRATRQHLRDHVEDELAELDAMVKGLRGDDTDGGGR